MVLHSPNLKLKLVHTLNIVYLTVNCMVTCSADFASIENKDDPSSLYFRNWQGYSVSPTLFLLLLDKGLEKPRYNMGYLGEME